MANDYRVPKEKAGVLVSAPPDAPRACVLFLASVAQSHHGAETASDIFAATQAFLPLFRENGELVLTRHDAIQWVRVDDPQRTEWYYRQQSEGIPRATVHLLFADGSALEGSVALVGPLGGQRVMDVVNRAEGFLHVEAGEELYLVNLGRVSAITVKEEPLGGAR